MNFRRLSNIQLGLKRLKWLLPVIGAVILLGIVIAFLVRQFTALPIDIDAIKMQDGKLVMENPNLNGVDGNKRPFSLAASRAIQDADRPKRIELEDIAARLPMETGAFADVKAGRGIYDAEEKTLVISEQILVETSDGYRIMLQDADVDIAAGRMQTKNPVSASSPEASIEAKRLLVQENGKHIIFDGGVIMMFNPGKFRERQEAGANQ